MTDKRPRRWAPIAWLGLAAAWGTTAAGQTGPGSDAPIAGATPEPAPGPSQAALLRAGETVTLRVRRVTPFDGRGAGERLLSGLPPVAEGDRVVAEVVAPLCRPPALVGGTVVRIVPPRRF